MLAREAGLPTQNPPESPSFPLPSLGLELGSGAGGLLCVGAGVEPLGGPDGVGAGGGV